MYAINSSSTANFNRRNLALSLSFVIYLEVFYFYSNFGSRKRYEQRFFFYFHFEYPVFILWLCVVSLRKVDSNQRSDFWAGCESYFWVLFEAGRDSKNQLCPQCLWIQWSATNKKLWNLRSKIKKSSSK